MPAHSLKYLITRCQAAYDFHSRVVEGFFPVGLIMKMPKGGKLLQKIKNAALIENKTAEPAVALSSACSIVVTRLFIISQACGMLYSVRVLYGHGHAWRYCRAER